MKTNNISTLIKEIDNSAELKGKLLDDPMGFLKNVDREEPMKNKWVFLFIVGIVGLTLTASLIIAGKIILESKVPEDASVPEFIISMGSTALGAIVGLLAPSPK